MDIIAIIKLLGGVGLFLYGMSLMGSSLEKLAGGKLEKILEMLTTSKKKGVGQIKGWVFGTGVTGIIQSSAAVTLMVCGFVNAGIMKLTQALPVVFGANVGSTVTAQILRLGDIASDNIILQLLKPSSFAAMLLAVGAFIVLFSKKKKLKDVAGILVGLGMLFYGMTIMEGTFEPLRSSEQFKSFFTSFKNPILGLLIGLVLTAIIQSSSASVGILQSLTSTGLITYSIAIPVIIGMNIGKCMPIVLGMLGSNKKARKVSVSYLLFNIFGAVFFMVLIYALHYTIGLGFFDNVVNRGNIANVHLLFNIGTSIFMLTITDKVAKICDKIVGEDEENEADKELMKLDPMLLNTPVVALEQCKQLITKMGEAIVENYKTATRMIYKYDAEAFPKMEARENFIDKCETALSSYVVRIDRHRLTTSDKLVVSEILNSISDFERMGDYCMNIAYVAQDKNEKKIHFSPYGHREVDTIVGAVEYTLDTVFEAFKNDDASLAVRGEPLSEVIDNLKEIIKSHHVERLQAGDCSIEGGVSLFDLINSFERIASHAANISLHVIKRVKGDSDFDEMHGHATDIFSEEYKALHHYYESQYIDPILRPMTEDEMKAILEDRSRREAEWYGRNEIKSEPEKIEGEKDKKKAEKSKNEDKGGKSEKHEKSEKTEKHEKSDKSEKSKRDEKSDKAKKDNKENRDEKSKKDEKDGKSDKDDDRMEKAKSIEIEELTDEEEEWDEVTEQLKRDDRNLPYNKDDKADKLKKYNKSHSKKNQSKKKK